ncbi:hypothetical protein [Thermomonas carbonis]|uniref:HAMP domain-containing protein n=1 Tax=Thermomonas carbonis TaxID=1463158 RepID=A0A7G9SPN7_9GAMM|nr:hypothetical protein [Thermomonas carbonis]QNN69812.1 hypothetical protein H9L16_14365 [Thermomonas carbonis]GHB95685.1 hypothetical protein GCM10010080_04090 [Thermomonas carbonis]
MSAIHGTRIRILLALAIVLPALLALLALQFARDDAREASRTLATLAKTQQLVEDQSNRNLTIRGELIAGNQAVVAYMTQALGSLLPGEAVDYSSIVDLLEERRSQLDLDLAAVVAADGRALAVTDAYAEGHDFANDPVFVEAKKTQSVGTGLWRDGERLLHVAMLPLARYNAGDAYLLVAEEVDQAYVKTIAGIAAADVALVASSASGRPVVLASTLPATDADALSRSIAESPADDASSAGHLGLAAGSSQAQFAPLFGNKEVRVVQIARRMPLSATLAAHVPSVLLALLSLAGLLAAIVWYGRRVASPLQALERLLERAATTPDRNLHMDQAGSTDVNRVAAAFNQLMAKSQQADRHD